MAVDELIKLLSTAFRKDSDSNNYKLLLILDSEFQNIEQTIKDIKNAHFVDYTSGKSLDYLAQLLNTRRLAGETDEHFRARLKIQFKKFASSATIKEIKEVVAAVLKTTTSRIKVRDRYDLEPALFYLYIYLQDLNSSGITVEELQEILRAIKPAGVNLQAFKLGTFTYRSGLETSDPSKGYNDLANSNPDAGTYAGLL